MTPHMYGHASPSIHPGSAARSLVYQRDANGYTLMIEQLDDDRYWYRITATGSPLLRSNAIDSLELTKRLGLEMLLVYATEVDSAR